MDGYGSTELVPVWLFQLSSKKFKSFTTDLPAYIALSTGQDANDQSFERALIAQNGTEEPSDATTAVELTCREARSLGVDWLLVDCVHVSRGGHGARYETVRSLMFWYSQALSCIAYVPDIYPDSDATDFVAWNNSVWSKELLSLPALAAAPILKLFGRDQRCLGDMSIPERIASLSSTSSARATLDRVHPSELLARIPSWQKIAWVASRPTTQANDVWSVLSGLFKIRPILDLKSSDRAFFLLQQEVIRAKAGDMSCLTWESSSDAPMHGVFADSIADFPARQDLSICSPLRFDELTECELSWKDTWRVTSFCYRREGDTVLEIGGARTSDGQHKKVGIRLRWNNQVSAYVRVPPYRLVVINEGDTVMTESLLIKTVICEQSAVDHGEGADEVPEAKDPNIQAQGEHPTLAEIYLHDNNALIEAKDGKKLGLPVKKRVHDDVDGASHADDHLEPLSKQTVQGGIFPLTMPNWRELKRPRRSPPLGADVQEPPAREAGSTLDSPIIEGVMSDAENDSLPYPTPSSVADEYIEGDWLDWYNIEPREPPSLPKNYSAFLTVKDEILESLRILILSRLPVFSSTSNASGNTSDSKALTTDAAGLGCPFYAAYKERHLACLKYGSFSDIRQVRHHLIRLHLVPHYCTSCSQKFESSVELARHLQENSCQSPTENYVVGISNDLQDRLAKLPPRNTDEQCWSEIFSVLFPSHQGLVSPYLQGSFENHVSEVQRLWEAEGIAIVVGCLRRICWQEEEAGDEDRLCEIVRGEVLSNIIFGREGWVVKPGECKEETEAAAAKSSCHG